MYTVERNKSFDKALLRLKRSGKFKKTHQDELCRVIDAIAQGKKLDRKYCDHQLLGNRKHLRECHVQGDLLLIYEIRKDSLVLLLLDIGSHAQLFD